MGMAASQARYLALTARKSNCEYEGQQINQSRLTLSNKSSALFNQMLGLSVPVPPSQQDYTSIQYSWSDGTTDYAITDWKKLASAESSDYNYIVNYYYETTEYQGSQKLQNNPQVQFSSSGPVSEENYASQIAQIEAAQRELASAKKDYETAQANYNTLVNQASSLDAFKSSNSVANITGKAYYPANATESDATGYTVTSQTMNDDGYLQYTYTYTNSAGTSVTEDRYFKNSKYYSKNASTGAYEEVTGESSSNYTPVTTNTIFRKYSSLANADGTASAAQTEITSAVDTLKAYGALDSDFSYNDVYAVLNDDGSVRQIAFASDLSNVPGTKTLLPVYDTADISDKQEAINAAKTQMDMCKITQDVAQAAVDALDVPTYVGNSKLTAITELTDDQKTAINQIIKDMQANDISTNLTKCFDTLSGVYDADTYTGGIYTYTVNDTTYYVTYQDLADSYISGESTNKSENQVKLPVYSAGDVTVRKENSQKALLETNTEGRFTSARFEDDSIVYTLNSEEKQDTVGYDDAMNQYNYDKALYDKKVQEINAQTSIIQQEDQNLELRLKQLDTEQNALSTEIDAVSKVVKDNVEKSFKTFSN